MWEPRLLTILRASMACYRDNFIFYMETVPGKIRYIWVSIDLNLSETGSKVKECIENWLGVGSNGGILCIC
jgi:hypothetical protein